MKKLILVLISVLYCIEMLAVIEYTDAAGLKYEIRSVENMTCALIGVESTEISGELIIPSTSSYAGHDFSVIELGKDCFMNCGKLTSVILPSSVTLINTRCFSCCSSLESITLPQSLKKISDFSFDHCRSLTSITIPSSVTEISWKAFEKCDNLRNVTIDESNEGDTILYLTTGVAYAESYNSLFASAEEAYLGRRIISLSANRVPYDFFSAPKLKKLVLGRNVKNWYVITDSQGHTEDCFSFYYFKSLERLECQALNPPYIPKASEALYMNLIVSVPQDSLELYKNADVWKSFWNLTGVSGIEEVTSDNPMPNFTILDRSLRIYNKPGESIVRVWSMEGTLLRETREDVISDLPCGIHILEVDGKASKILVK